MTDDSCYRLLVGSRRCAVTCSTPLAEDVGRALAGFPPVDGTPDRTLSIRLAADGGSVEILADGERGFTRTRRIMLDSLFNWLEAQYLDGDPTSRTSLIHAAGLSLAGRGVIAAGPSGVGKSSLAWAAARQGATVLSDEMVNVGSGDDGCWIEGFARPIHLRHPADDAEVARLTSGPGADRFIDAGFRLVAPLDAVRAEGGDLSSSPVQPDLIVVLTKAGRGEPDVLYPISPGRALLALTELSFDLARNSTAGFLALVDLVACCATASGPATAVLQPHQRSVDLPDVEVVAPDESWRHTWRDWPLRCPSDLLTVIIDDEVVLWRPADNGRTLLLDGAAARWWRSGAALPPYDACALDDDELAVLVEELIDVGVLSFAPDEPNQLGSS